MKGDTLLNILLITSLYPGYKNQPRTDATYALHDFAKEWVKKGHKVLVCSLWTYYPWIFNIFSRARNKKRYAYLEKFEMDNVQIYRCPLKKIPKLTLSEAKALKEAQLISEILNKERFNPSIILAHPINAGGLVSFKVKESIQVPLVIGIHSSDLIEINKKKIRDIIWKNESKIDMYAFRSYSLLRNYEESLKDIYLPAKKCFTALSGIDIKNKIGLNILRNKIDRPIKTFITVGRLIPQKKIDIVIKAFAGVSKTYDNLKLVIIGDGFQRRQLERLSKKLNVRNKVEFLGKISRKEVFENMRKSDAFVLVSSPETFGLVYLEAMASGCVTVGTKNEGIDGIIVNGENGFLCNSNNVEELKNILLKIIKMDKNKKEDILSNALTTVEKMSLENVAAYYVDSIRNLL